MIGELIKWSWICSDQEEDQQGNYRSKKLNLGRKKRKRKQGTMGMSRNVFEELGAFICVLELTFIPS